MAKKAATRSKKSSPSTTAKAAASTTKKKSSAHSAASVAATDASGSALAASTRATTVLAGLASGITPLTAAQQAALNVRFSDADCDALGAQTRSVNVINLALQWGVIAAVVVRKVGFSIAGYSQMLFLSLLNNTEALVAAVGDAAAARSSKSVSSTTASTQHVAAHSAMSRLDLAMVAAVGRRAGSGSTTDAQAAADRTALAAIRLLTSTDDELIATIGSLAALATTWLGRTTGTSATRAAGAGLTTALIAAATQAAATLAAQASADALAGRVSTKDSPAINRLEGRALLELKALYEAFTLAKVDDPTIPTLPLVKGTAHIFVSHASSTAASATPAPAPAPTTPAPTGATPPVRIT